MMIDLAQTRTLNGLAGRAADYERRARALAWLAERWRDRPSLDEAAAAVGLSPFHLGPCQLYSSYVSQKMENAWQYLKVYAKYADTNGPNAAYWAWAQDGWANARARVRSPS